MYTYYYLDLTTGPFNHNGLCCIKHLRGFLIMRRSSWTQTSLIAGWPFSMHMLRLIYEIVPHAHAGENVPSLFLFFDRGRNKPPRGVQYNDPFSTEPLVFKVFPLSRGKCKGSSWLGSPLGRRVTAWSRSQPHYIDTFRIITLHEDERCPENSLRWWNCLSRSTFWWS